MDKQEFIHLHGLLAEVAEYTEEEEDVEIDLEEYIELAVRPTSIHKSKSDHKAAVFALADGINRAIGARNEVSEVTERALEETPPDLGEAYGILAGHAVHRVEEGLSYASVELTQELFEELGPNPEWVLRRLDGQYIDVNGGYEPGSEARLVL